MTKGGAADCRPQIWQLTFASFPLHNSLICLSSQTSLYDLFRCLPVSSRLIYLSPNPIVWARCGPIFNAKYHVTCSIPQPSPYTDGADA